MVICVNGFQGIAQRVGKQMKRIRLAQRRKVLGLSQDNLAELLGVDPTTVRRWEAGRSEPQPWMRPRLAKALKVSVEAVGGLLGETDEGRADGWSVPVPAEFLWPELRDSGMSPGGRALKELSNFVRSDMLSRRETLAQAVKAVSGPALLAPIAGWLGEPEHGPAAREHGTQRIGVGEVEAIERSTRYFAATDAEVGGALSREAAVGQLKYAVDLARYASYSDATGNRLLAVIAELSGLVGWMCHDSGMPGPAQRYFAYGLRAARQSTDERARLLVVSVLSDMAEHMKWLDRPKTALNLDDQALAQLPSDHRFDVPRALLAAKRAENSLCHLGFSREVDSALNMAFELYGQATVDEGAMVWHRAIDVSVGELAVSAAVSCLVLARAEPRMLAEAEKYTLMQLDKVPEGQVRSRLFAQIRLATIRFRGGEAEQGCADGERALEMAGPVKSAMIRRRMRELLADAESYADMPSVAGLCAGLRAGIAGRDFSI